MLMTFIISNYSGVDIIRQGVSIKDSVSFEEVKDTVDKLHEVWRKACTGLTSAHFTSKDFNCFHDCFSFDIPENVVTNSVLQIIAQKRFL